MLEHPKPTHPKKTQNFSLHFVYSILVRPLFCGFIFFGLDVVAKSRAPLYTSFLSIILNSLFFLLKKKKSHKPNS